MSHHLDTPLAAQTGQLYIDDLYVFPGESSTVFVMDVVVGTPAVYGFAARNGRTLADNAHETMLSLVTNTAVRSGLKPSVAKDQRVSHLPYVVPA